MPNYNPYPRDEFLTDSEAVKAHHVLVENKALRHSLSVALSQHSRQLAEKLAADLGGAGSCFLRIQGAHEFVNTFLNLAETSVVAPINDTLNLPGNIKPLPARKN